jgi:polyisoprenyl-phosphate glycosyltransferase
MECESFVMLRPKLLSIVIPCFRSAEILENTVNELFFELKDFCPLEVILVNDNSPDTTQEVIQRLCHANSSIHFIENGRNRGQHYATLRGFAATRGDVVVTVDDDGQNPPSSVKLVVETLLARGHDITYGKFATTNQTAFRKFASRLNQWMSKFTLGNTQGLSVTNVRAIVGSLARAITASRATAPYIDVLLWSCATKVSEVLVEQRPRAAGISTYSFWSLMRLWMSHLTLMTIIPLQIASYGSLCVSFFAGCAALFQIGRTLLSGSAPSGWLSLFLSLCFFFGLLFAFLAIAASYLGRIYVEQNRSGIYWARSSSEQQK